MGSAQDDEVPHIIIRSPRLRSGKIVFGDAKRLLQHYLPIAEVTLNFGQRSRRASHAFGGSNLKAKYPAVADDRLA
jgi:hypothetical protein